MTIKDCRVCITSHLENIVEIGSEYRTFSIPAAERVKGRLYDFDVDMEMINNMRVSM